MALEKSLREHMAACEQTYKLMLEENRLLKSTGEPPAAEFLSEKKTALRQLEITVEALRSFRDDRPDEKNKHRALIQKTQQLVLKALLLDRENEQLLLKASLGSRPQIPAARPSLSQVQNLYRKHLAA